MSLSSATFKSNSTQILLPIDCHTHKFTGSGSKKRVRDIVDASEKKTWCIIVQCAGDLILRGKELIHYILTTVYTNIFFSGNKGSR